MTDTAPDIELPTSTKPSRLDKPAKPDAEDQIVRAADRFAVFRRKHKGGHHDAVLEQVIHHADGHLTYIVRGMVWTVWPSFGAEPDATALTACSTRDENPIIAASPLDSADTIARSRAMRNLGILPFPKRAQK